MKEKMDITKYDIKSATLPTSFDNCRIALLADLHNNQVGEGNSIILKALEEYSPDYILCAGDMIVGSRKGKFEKDAAIDFLQEAVTIAPVFYSCGNHEERLREPLYFENEPFDNLKNELESIGITFLDNHSFELVRENDIITISGLSLPLDFYTRWWKRKPLCVDDISQRIGDKRNFTILMAHNPIYFPIYDTYGAELVLSGHVHGGLMVLPGIGGVLSPELLPFPKYDFGLFSGEKSQMVLSRGLGAHTLPIRINNRPELVLITLKSACEL